MFISLTVLLDMLTFGVIIPVLPALIAAWSSLRLYDYRRRLPATPSLLICLSSVFIM